MVLIRDRDGDGDRDDVAYFAYILACCAVLCFALLCFGLVWFGLLLCLFERGQVCCAQESVFFVCTSNE